MKHLLTINGRLKSMNDYTDAQRVNRYKGAKMKSDEQEKVEWAITAQLHSIQITKPIIIEYSYYEKNKKRDLDNISGFAHKVVQDALVSKKIIKDDGWDEVIGFSDRFFVDSKNPRIEILIKEVDVAET